MSSTVCFAPSIVTYERDLAEIRRSAEEDRDFSFAPIDRSQVERYLNPPANTIYPLEYAHHLLGDIHEKTILDLGCGKGENLIPIAERAGHVIGIDISPELVRLAQARIQSSTVNADVVVGSAYETGIPDATVDVIFCAALIHHLDIPRVRTEMARILRKGGFVVLSEPIRFSKLYDRLRKLLPARRNISEYEHPLTTAEFEYLLSGFELEDVRYFRLPFVPMMRRWKKMNYFACNLSAWLIAKVPVIRHFGTSAVVRLRKRTTD